MQSSASSQELFWHKVLFICKQNEPLKFQSLEHLCYVVIHLTTLEMHLSPRILSYFGPVFLQTCYSRTDFLLSQCLFIPDASKLIHTVSMHLQPLDAVNLRHVFSAHLLASWNYQVLPGSGHIVDVFLLQKT